MPAERGMLTGTLRWIYMEVLCRVHSIHNSYIIHVNASSKWQSNIQPQGTLSVPQLTEIARKAYLRLEPGHWYISRKYPHARHVSHITHWLLWQSVYWLLSWNVISVHRFLFCLGTGGWFGVCRGHFHLLWRCRTSTNGSTWFEFILTLFLLQNFLFDFLQGLGINLSVYKSRSKQGETCLRHRRFEKKNKVLMQETAYLKIALPPINPNCLRVVSFRANSPIICQPNNERKKKMFTSYWHTHNKRRHATK